MPSITDHKATNSIKLLLMGDSGTGKTGALCSLVTAGYKLRILDLDNGLDIVASYLTNKDSIYQPQIAAKKINLAEAVIYETITEKMKNVNGKIMPASATVWTRTVNMLEKWKSRDGQELGAPRSWDQDTILVLDSLTFLAKAALDFIQSLNGRLGNDTPGFDLQRDINQAQTLLENLLRLLYDDAFLPNVVVISHLTYRNPDGTDREDKNVSKKGYPSALGVALSPRIPRYFNTTLLSETSGIGSTAKRMIKTQPQGAIDLKTQAPLKVKGSYPIETALGDIFTALRG
jgi:hypothetical protein